MESGIFQAIIYLCGHQDNTRMRRYVAELRRNRGEFSGSRDRVLQICRRNRCTEPFREGGGAGDDPGAQKRQQARRKTEVNLLDGLRAGGKPARARALNDIEARTG